MRQKHERTIFYEQYKWPKCTFWTFVSRCIKFWTPREEAIKPRRTEKNSEQLKKYRKFYPSKNKAPLWWFLRSVWRWIPKERAIIWVKHKDVYEEEYKKWNNYKWEKCSFNTYLIRKWSLPFEQAIRKREQKPYEIVQHKEKKRVRTESDYYIEVTYHPDEATVFHKRFKEIISDLENKIYSEEDYTKLKELEKKLEKIKDIYKVFISYNPIPW